MLSDLIRRLFLEIERRAKWLQGEASSVLP